jgi:hypothetical protein
MRVSLVGALALSTVTLSGCASPPLIPAYEQFDACEATTSSFAAKVACGKERRAAYCQAQGACSSEGNAVIAYANALVQSINAKTMTEPEAQRKWIEFKLARSDERRRVMLQEAAIAAGSGPTTCHTFGRTTTCN